MLTYAANAHLGANRHIPQANAPVCSACCNVVAVVMELYAVDVALMPDENSQRVVLVHAPDACCRMCDELKASYTGSV